MRNKTDLVYLNENIFRRRVFLKSVRRKKKGQKTLNIKLLTQTQQVSCNTATFSGTHSLRTLPGEGTRLGLHCGPMGIWSSNFPPEATPPPAGPAVCLLWSAAPLLLALGRSALFCVGAANELVLLSTEDPVSNSAAQHITLQYILVFHSDSPSPP